jgi:hypothetical protein
VWKGGDFPLDNYLDNKPFNPFYDEKYEDLISCEFTESLPS